MAQGASDEIGEEGTLIKSVLTWNVNKSRLQADVVGELCRSRVSVASLQETENFGEIGGAGGEPAGANGSPSRGEAAV